MVSSLFQKWKGQLSSSKHLLPIHRRSMLGMKLISLILLDHRPISGPSLMDLILMILFSISQLLLLIPFYFSKETFPNKSIP
jgi:hypothetical protein